MLPGYGQPLLVLLPAFLPARLSRARPQSLPAHLPRAWACSLPAYLPWAWPCSLPAYLPRAHPARRDRPHWPHGDDFNRKVRKVKQNPKKLQ